MTDKFYWNLISVLAILNGVLFLFKDQLINAGNHFGVLLGGNAILALVTVYSYFITKKGAGHENNNVFVRKVYASTLLKLFLCLLGIGIYVLTNRSNISKSTIFLLMGFYVIYTVFETFSLQKLLRRKQ